MRKALIIIPLVTGLIIGGITMTKGNADTVPPIVQEVTHQGEVLDNHEARITNLETDTKDLQTNTQTAPSTNKVVVKEVTTPKATEPLYSEPASQPAPTPTPEPQPEPVVVVSYRQIPVDEYKTDCELTYSDGTTKRWLWRTTWYNQGSLVGKEDGRCDSSVIGNVK